MELTHWASGIPWTAITNQELTDLIDMAQTEHARRQRIAAGPPKPKMVAVSLTLDAGNTRAGAKSWCKVITSIDPSKGNGYGIDGEFLHSGYDSKRRSTGEYTAGLSEGTLLLIGGSGGSHKNQTRYYVLAVVQEGAALERDSGYQHFSAAGVQFICSSQSGPKTGYDRQAMLDQYPALAPAAQTGLLPIYYELAKRGLC